jgi:chromosome segregation ATPase
MENETTSFQPPVTESEMSQFFQRLATMAVGYSSQAKALEDIRREVSNLCERIHVLEQENAKLRSEVGETWEFAHRVEAEREEVKRDLQVERDINARLVKELEDARAHNDQLFKELADAGERNRTLNGDLSAMSTNYAEAKSSVEYWSQRCNRAEGETNDARNTSAERGRHIHQLEAEIHSLKTRLEKVKQALDEQVQAVQAAVA